MSLGRWGHVTSEFGGEYARHLVRSDCQLEFATRENNFHFLSCLDLRRKMVQTWKLFGYGRAKFIAWFCYFFSLRTFRRRCGRKDYQWRIQNLEKEHTVFVRFGDDPCVGMAKPYCTMATWRYKVSACEFSLLVFEAAWIDRIEELKRVNWFLSVSIWFLSHCTRNCSTVLVK